MGICAVVFPTCCTATRPLVEGRTSIDQPTRSLQYYKAGPLETPHLLQMLQFCMSVAPAFKRTCTHLYLHCSVCKRTQLFGSSIEFPLTFLRFGCMFMYLIRLTVSTNTGPWFCTQKIVCIYVRNFIQKFQNSPPGLRTASSRALCPVTAC